MMNPIDVGDPGTGQRTASSREVQTIDACIIAAAGVVVNATKRGAMSHACTRIAFADRSPHTALASSVGRGKAADRKLRRDAEIGLGVAVEELLQHVVGVSLRDLVVDDALVA